MFDLRDYRKHWFFLLPWLVGMSLGGNASGQDRVANEKAADRLFRAVKLDYSYRDRLKIDWTARAEEFRPRFLAASDKAAFAKIAVDFLSVAKDVHIWIQDGDRVIGTFQPDLRPNFNPRVLPRLIPDLKQHGKTVLVGRWPDGIRYLAIGTWENREPASIKEALEAVKSAANDKAPLIVDVRPNTGGNEILARSVATHFVKKTTPYAKHIIRSEGKDMPVQSRSVEPDPSGGYHPGPVLVLMGPANISTCESFLLMMRAAKAKLVGSRSTGASGNPKPQDLGNGLIVMLPSWRNLSVDERELEGVGIEPDVTVKTTAEDLKDNDPVLAKALELLRAK